MCVGNHYSQENTNNVNKTWALLQTTGGKDEPPIVEPIGVVLLQKIFRSLRSVLLIFLVFCVLLLCVFTFCVSCCDFRIQTMVGSSLPPVVCKRAHVLLTLFVFNKNKQKHNTMCVGNHYPQANTNNVNKTWALLQTTGGKDEPTIVCMRKSQHETQKAKSDMRCQFLWLFMLCYHFSILYCLWTLAH
jgi:hypothetical protein